MFAYLYAMAETVALNSAAEGAKILSPEREAAVEKALRQMNSSWKFQSYLLAKLPIAWLAGMRLEKLERQQCTASMPYRWLSQNPFQSIYFATQAMAAELSTGALAILAIAGCKPGVAMLIVHMEATYGKKANEKVYYTCTEGQKLFDAVDRAIRTGEGQRTVVETVGRLKDGTEVSRFKFTWSFKQRRS